MPEIDDLEERLEGLEREIEELAGGSLRDRFEDVEETLGEKIDDLESRLADLEEQIESLR